MEDATDVREVQHDADREAAVAAQIDAALELLENAEKTIDGFVLKRTSDYVVDVSRMLYNWRLQVARAEEYGRQYEHGFCYFGTGMESLGRVALAAAQWNDPLNTLPEGFDKQAY